MGTCDNCGGDCCDGRRKPLGGEFTEAPIEVSPTLAYRLLNREYLP